MPTYKNNTKRRITHNDKGILEWFPGQERKLRYFVPHDLLGLTMISPEPYVLRENKELGYNEMYIQPGTPVEDRTYQVPYWESVEVSVFALRTDGGCVTNKDLLRMYVGDSAVPIVVDMNNHHFFRYAWDMCAYLIFESDISSVVTIKVEPFTARGTERRDRG